MEAFVSSYSRVEGSGSGVGAAWMQVMREISNKMLRAYGLLRRSIVVWQYNICGSASERECTFATRMTDPPYQIVETTSLSELPISQFPWCGQNSRSVFRALVKCCAKQVTECVPSVT